MDSDNKCININEVDIIKNKKRGDILYYSISQVANILGQEDGTIRYYTNVFDNILKIEISNKEFTYTSKDIDKLEFLINLKNKGMTIKEIQNYCEALPLNLEDIVEIKENNSLSIKEIVTTIIGLENKEINNMKEYLVNKIKEDNELSIEKIVNLIKEEQEKKLDLFRDDLLKEIKEYIDYKFDMDSKMTRDLYNEFFTKLDNLVSEKHLLENNIKLQLDKYNETSISRDKNLITEIKRFENVMERAYYIQQDMESQKKEVSFIGRLLGLR